MNFPLIQLYTLNRSKPIVEVDGIDEDFNLENIYEICQRKQTANLENV